MFHVAISLGNINAYEDPETLNFFTSLIYFFLKKKVNDNVGCRPTYEMLLFDETMSVSH